MRSCVGMWKLQLLCEIMCLVAVAVILGCSSVNDFFFPVPGTNTALTVLRGDQSVKLDFN